MILAGFIVLCAFGATGATASRTWHVFLHGAGVTGLHGAGVTGLLGTTVDRSGRVVLVEAVDVPQMHQLTSTERTELEGRRVLVLPLPGRANGFLLEWAFGACSKNQKITIDGDGAGLSVIVDHGPTSPSPCDDIGLAAELRVSSADPISPGDVLAVSAPEAVLTTDPSS